MSDKYKSIADFFLEDMPIETTLRVGNGMALIAFLTDNGFIEDREWEDTPEDDAMFEKINNWAEDHTKYQMENIKEWEANGRPE